MPENDNTADAGEQVQQEQAGFSAPSSQEELDRIIQKRIERERSKFADYDDLKLRRRSSRSSRSPRSLSLRRRRSVRRGPRGRWLRLVQRLSVPRWRQRRASLWRCCLATLGRL